jgi:FAD binding domain
MNTGIGDAENLAWKLALVVQGAVSGSAADRLLDSYQAERCPQAEDVLKSTTGALDAIVGSGLRARLTRAVFFPLTRLGPVQRPMWYGMSQLGVSYRGGPLAPQSRLGVRRGLRPGDRVPDIACQTSRGEPTRLYVELRGYWAVLAPDLATADDLATRAQQLGIPVVALEREQFGIVQAYWDSHGQRHSLGVRAVLEQARDQGQFDHDADLDLIHEILYATITYDLAAEPDTHNARDIAERLTAVLRQSGYQSEGLTQR